MAAQVRCIGCKAFVDIMDGATDLDSCASPGCLAIYREAFVKRYRNPEYTEARHLAADAYWAQHPGIETPGARGRIAGHLIRLHLVFVLGHDLNKLPSAHQVSARQDGFKWLAPPVFHGATTIRYILETDTPEEHLSRVKGWAHAVWNTWEQHQDTVRVWAEKQNLN